MAFFRWLHFQHRNLFEITFAIPNAARRSPQLGAYMKAEGLKAGVWDVFVPWPTEKHSGLWLEFKIAPNKLSPSQVLFQERMLPLGYAMVIVYSLEEAISAVEKYYK